MLSVTAEGAKKELPAREASKYVQIVSRQERDLNKQLGVTARQMTGRSSLTGFSYRQLLLSKLFNVNGVYPVKDDLGEIRTRFLTKGLAKKLDLVLSLGIFNLDSDGPGFEEILRLYRHRLL